MKIIIEFYLILKEIPKRLKAWTFVLEIGVGRFTKELDLYDFCT